MPSAKVADGSYSTRPTLKNGMKRKRLALTTFVCDGWRHRLAASSFRFLRSFVAEKSGEDRQRDIELYKVLRSKKAELEELLKARISELRTICLREGVGFVQVLTAQPSSCRLVPGNNGGDARGDERHVKAGRGDAEAEKAGRDLLLNPGGDTQE